MNTLLNRIISLNVELEGALRVVANRPSEEALENAKNKFAEISALFAMLTPTQMLASKEEEITEIKIEEAEGAESEPFPEADPKDGEEMLEIIRKTENEVPLESSEDDTPEQEEMEEKFPSMTSDPTTIETRYESRDIRKMFTLNDKFLFKRELFGNNDEEFNANLDLIASMRSFEEAKEYAYDDLRWDEKNPRVRDFMAIVQGYFA